MDDFDFDLAEVSLDGNLPAVNNDYSDFTFNMDGGANNNNPADINLKTMDLENMSSEKLLPGEEMLDPEPKKAVEIASNEPNEPEKLNIQLVDEPMNGPSSNEETTSVPTPREATNSEIMKQLPIVRKPDEGNKPHESKIDLDLSTKPDNKGVANEPTLVEGLLSDDLDENLSRKNPLDVILNVDDDETGGPVIVENLDDLDQLKTSIDTDQYLQELRNKVKNSDFKSEEANNYEDISSVNKMNSSDYDSYIVRLREFFKDMNSKKKTKFEYSISDNGNLYRKDLETEDIEEIEVPKYINIKNEIKENKEQLGNLIYSISSIRKNIFMDEKNKFYQKNSEKFNALIRDMVALNKRTKQLTDYLELANNTEVLQKTNDLITEMKTNQSINYLRIKESLRDSSLSYKERYSIILEYIKNNKRLMTAYGKTRQYLDVDDSEYIICEKVTKSRKQSLQSSDTSLETSNSGEDASVDLDRPPTTKAKSNLYSRFVKGKTLNPDTEAEDDAEDANVITKTPLGALSEADPYWVDSNAESEAEDNAETPVKKALDINDMNAEQLDLDDDIEDYAAKFDNNVGYPDTDLDEDEEVDPDYKFNSSAKMTKEKKLEMDVEQKRDREIPLEDNIGDPKKVVEPDTTLPEAPKPGDISGKSASKILRKLNKKADENIKVIELNTDLSMVTKCDDKKTKRSNLKTTNVVNGKKSRKRNIDPELKNCMFPFKTMEGQGKGKKKKAIYNEQCVPDGGGEICATERNPDCTMKKFAYCEK